MMHALYYITELPLHSKTRTTLSTILPYADICPLQDVQVAVTKVVRVAQPLSQVVAQGVWTVTVGVAVQCGFTQGIVTVWSRMQLA